MLLPCDSFTMHVSILFSIKCIGIMLINNIYFSDAQLYNTTSVYPFCAHHPKSTLLSPHAYLQSFCSENRDLLQPTVYSKTGQVLTDCPSIFCQLHLCCLWLVVFYSDFFLFIFTFLSSFSREPCCIMETKGNQRQPSLSVLWAIHSVCLNPTWEIFTM